MSPSSRTTRHESTAYADLFTLLTCGGASDESIARSVIESRDIEVSTKTRDADAEIIRSFIPKGTDDESKAVAYALTLAANAVERGRR